MAEADLDALLKRMPEIAEAINRFTSEAIQHEALVAMLRAFSGTAIVDPPKATKSEAQTLLEENNAPETTPKSNVGVTDNKAKRKRASSGSGFSMIKGLDLNPKGKKSFSEFIADKQVTANLDKITLITYYLAEIKEEPEISSDMIGTTFRMTPGWPEPGNLIQAIRDTSHRKGAIDTSSFKDIKLTPQGRNFVEITLPAKQK